MWIDEDRGVHTVAVLTPRDLFPADLIEAIDRLGAAEVEECLAALDELFHRIMNAVSVQSVEEEASWEFGEPPVCAPEPVAVGGPMSGRLIRLVESQSLRWQLDYVEALCDILESNNGDRVAP
jgi:hypothetical protein